MKGDNIASICSGSSSKSDTVLRARKVLLLRGGQDVGQHLQLLRNYLPGYRVSWGGALLGLGYGAVLGGALGGLLATTYNAVAARRSAA